MSKINTVGVVLWDQVERLDFEGPLGVLGWAADLEDRAIDVRFLTLGGVPVKDHLLHRCLPVDGMLEEAESFDLLLVPGGDLKKNPSLMGNKAFIGEIARLGVASAYLASVCTGAFLVAESGLADGMRMTTHWEARNRFRAQFSKPPHNIELVADRVVAEKDGKLWSSAGISAGVDLALRLVAATGGPSLASRTQCSLEYFPEPLFFRREDGWYR